MESCCCQEAEREDFLVCEGLAGAASYKSGNTVLRCTPEFSDIAKRTPTRTRHLEMQEVERVGRGGQASKSRVGLARYQYV